jgi:dipeptidyl aminopeptidase/acylaminoacyl peptidase
VIARPADASVRVVHRDDDEKWWSLPPAAADAVPSPDGRLIAFLSDRDGWDHLYLLPVAGGPAVQVTRGRYEVARPRWSPDSRRVVFDTNEGENPGVRHLAMIALDAEGRPGPPMVLTKGRGTNTTAVWSPDGARLVYQHADPHNSPDLFVLDARPDMQPTRLSDSIPASIDRSAFVEPSFVRYRSADGRLVPAYLFVSQTLDRSVRHPAIVWVHGDGTTQNFDGWHLRRDYAIYYSLHQQLAAQGYIVLAVDYRGSTGYGREWRQGHFRDLGGGDLEDVAAGRDFLGTLGFVDSERVGVWGLSYGGFLVVQALTAKPMHFRCGVNIAGVVDFEWYRTHFKPWVDGGLESLESILSSTNARRRFAAPIS